MSLIVIKCAQCGANFEIDKTNKKSKCEYCGANCNEEESTIEEKFKTQPQYFYTNTTQKEYFVPSFYPAAKSKKKILIVIGIIALVTAIIVGIVLGYCHNLMKVEEINTENHSEYLHTHISLTINPPNHNQTMRYDLVITNKNNRKWISGTITVAFSHRDENMERTISFIVAPGQTSEYTLIDGSRSLGVSYGHSTGVLFVEGKAEYR